MGSNTGDGYRVGAVKDRKQVKNPKTKHYVKIDTNTGKIIASKGTPYKGVTLKKNKSKK